MKKETFKKGDRVYHTDFGWGVIEDIDNCDSSLPLLISFDSGTSHYTPTKSVSFTEYTLQGFSQERPIELPEVGELCLVRKTTISEWSVDKFGEFINGKDFPFISVDGTNWKELKRIKILD